MKSKQKTGHPAKPDEDILRLKKAMTSAVELSQSLSGRLTEEQHSYLRASALGLMLCYSTLTGMPSPLSVLDEPSQDLHAL